MCNRPILGGAFALALLAAPVVAPACDLAKAPTDRWGIETDRRGVAWLRTPCGDRFYSLGVNALDGGYPWREHAGKTWYSWKAFAPSLADWAAATRQRLQSWGFNTAGGWSLQPALLGMPTIVNLELGRNARFHWFDPFDPAVEPRMMALARELVAPYRGSPYRIGYFSDNEVGWWAGALFVFYSAKPADSFTKRRWLAMLRERYADDWGRFAADFVPPAGVDDWGALLTATEPTHLRAGGHGIAAVREWCGLVAEHYYALAEKAIRAADPDALYFGDRLPIYYDPAAVRAMARHVDAIATNYNPDAGDGWIAHYFWDGLERLTGGKPILVTEWFFAARQNRTGNLNNGHLMTVDTQAERARGAAAADAAFAAIPEVIGAHWFQYYDHPKGGRPDGEDYDFGLVDVDNVPYRRLTAALSEVNRRAAAIHAAAPATPPAMRDDAVPYAAISLAARSLADWPKPASLLPPLTASPGAVDFGEVYLSWSAAGLNLATVGQDYYDIDLFAYDGPFPLGEAYRVELGVDAGAGPRRFTLFFIPPRRRDPVHRDYQHMEAELCAGTAAVAETGGCTAPPGAAAVYFGADQPRVTAELTIPWSALGIAPPAVGAGIAAEVALTSWHGERWMSLSGQPPDKAMADPALWRKLHLGDGVSATPPPARGGRPG
ncbi:MAG TPA: hypothetical protein VMB84_15595 [Stellaceae bacterium]|nr:hypothetical protein [Stellaceae bacterium]